MSPKTVKCLVTKLYEICPEGFTDFSQRQDSKILNSIVTQIKKYKHPFVFFVLCCVLNISYNKQKNIIKYLNYEWNNDPLFDDYGMCF